MRHLYSKKAQQDVDKFIKELVDKLVKKYPKDIDFVILYGSAARDEFVRGVSDIDLVIQVKSDQSIETVKKFSTELFWKLDKKYKTGFDQSCSTKKEKNIFSKLLNKLENECQLYTPLFIFGPHDMDWKRAKVTKKGMTIGANLFVSQATVFYKFKTEGRMYYGRDIRKDINVELSFWERYKGILIPHHLTTFALALWPIMPRRATKYATKALLYELDAALVFVKDADTRIERKYKKVKKLGDFAFTLKDINDIVEFNFSMKFSALKKKDYHIIEEALQYKINGFKKGRFAALGYILRALSFVVRLNYVVLFRRLFKK